MNNYKSFAVLGILSFGLMSCSMFRDGGETAEFREDGLFGESDPTKLAEHALSAARSEAKSERARTLETYFKQGDYKEAAEMAEDLTVISEPGSEDLDVALFISGVSHYYLGNHEKADEALQKHAESFPQSRHRESASYYSGSNLVKLKRWRVAGEQLDIFLKRYPESILMEFALYDRALCHYETAENDLALERIGELERGFVYSKIRDRALALKGDILAQGGKYDEAVAAYGEAGELAVKLGHQQTHARSLQGLVEANAKSGDIESATDYYREFFKLYKGSPNAVDAAIAGLPVMEAGGRIKEGLGNLEDVMFALPADAPAAKMNEALREYGKFYVKKNGPEKLLRRFDNLSADSEEKKRLHEQIVIARLEVLEDYFPDREAEIRVFYEEVGTHFAREDMSIETLVKLARHVAVKDKHSAQLILEEALERPETEFQDSATLEHAKILIESPDVREQHLAVVGFKKVLDVYGNPELTEEATLGLARYYSKQEDWTNAYVYWDAYLKNPNWESGREEAAGQFEIAKVKAGPIPAKPVELVDSALANADLSPIERQVEEAKSLVDQGKKEQAFETVTRLIDQHPDVANLSTKDSKALRRANIIQQDLAVELGMGARLVEP